MSSTLWLVGGIGLLVLVLVVYVAVVIVEEHPGEKPQPWRHGDPVPPHVQAVADGWRRWRGRRSGRGGPR